MNQSEVAGLGAEPDAPDAQVVDDSTEELPKKATKEKKTKPQLYSSSKGGFGCKYYYHVEHDVELEDPDFIRWDRINMDDDS